MKLIAFLWSTLACALLAASPMTPGQQATAEQGLAPAAVPAEAPLTNPDIVKLCKLDLGDEIVVAKINQAKIIDFRLDTDSLIELKGQGVSKPVIEAMLKRATPPSPSQAAPASPDGMQPAANGGGAVTAAYSQGYARLCTQDGDMELTSIAGSDSGTYAFVTVLHFMDYPEIAATVRTTDNSPSVLLRVQGSPPGRVYWVKADPDKGDNARSVKLGRSGVFGVKSVTTPDKDWTIPFDAKEEQPGIWRLTPKRPVVAGEYGIWVGTGELYDFGVDR